MHDNPEERAAIKAEGRPVQRIRARTGDSIPKIGDYCGCCKSSLWWTETEAPKGWRCCYCHPPAHLAPEKYKAMAT